MNELDVLEITWKVLIFHSFFTGFTQLLMTAPYGRYARAGYGITLNARFTWLVQECPSFLVPLFVTAYLGGNQWKAPNLVLLSMFLLHYFHRQGANFHFMYKFTDIFNCRSFHYPFVIKGSKPVPLMIFVVSLIFCAINGYMQSRYLLHYYSYTDQWFYDPRFIIGVVMFLFGMAINIHSDAILRGLRKPNETGYKIPKGVREYLSHYFVNCSLFRWIV